MGTAPGLPAATIARPSDFHAASMRFAARGFSFAAARALIFPYYAMSVIFRCYADSRYCLMPPARYYFAIALMRRQRRRCHGGGEYAVLRDTACAAAQRGEQSANHACGVRGAKGAQSVQAAVQRVARSKR